MTSDGDHSAGLDNQEQYEATVLDFLDREMAAVQPAPAKDKQLDDLDALVSDLLKQVITEADQPQDGRAILNADKPLFDNEDELFAGLRSAPETAPPTAAEIAKPEREPEIAAESETPPQSASPDIQTVPEAEKSEPEEVPVKVEAEPQVRKAEPVPIPSFASAPAVAGKKTTVIAAVLAVLILGIGSAVYFLSGSSDKRTESAGSEHAVTQSADTAIPVAPAPRETTAPAVESTTVAPAKTKAGPSAPAGKPTAATAKPDSKVTAPASSPAPPARQEPQPAVQSQPSPPPVIPPAAMEKPAPAENAAPANPVEQERKPAPAQAAEAPALAPESPAPAARTLVPAAILSQSTPVFPELALRSRSSGSVVLELQIDEQGRVVKATPVSGPPVFYNAAVTAAMKWRYKPASIGGVNVRSQSRTTIDFKLKK